jgi:Domain of unknown function (DUF4159)/Aerotolerance regulator N-terminal
MSGFALGAPLLLAALVVLPAIWFLLRLTPPRPKQEVFPPLRILASVIKRDETPATSPWWLTLLRMLAAALVIFALAEPVINPGQTSVSTSGPLVILMDNSWATASSWDRRVRTASALIDEARTRNLPVSIAFTAEKVQDTVPGTAASASEKLAAAQPRPLIADRTLAIEALKTGLAGTRPGTLAFITDGTATGDADTTMTALATLGAGDLRRIEGEPGTTITLTSATNGGDAMTVNLTRLETGTAQTISLSAQDVQGRTIANGKATFAAGQNTATGTIEAPFELRNDFASVRIDGAATAGATFLMDDGFKRRKVALLTGESRDLSQLLLSPLYYIKRALQPYADLSEPQNADLVAAIPELIKDRPSVLITADIGRLPEETYRPLQEWIANGGTLIRFAGPRLAAAPADDPLVPVILRQGERELGGALSWTEPQPLADYPANSPFAGMKKPDDILVKRQVLAEPTQDLAERTWANLADGTPLVTKKDIGSGRIVLFHVSAEATWSDLPLSGQFVEMLRRIVQLSRASGVSQTEKAGDSLPPYRLLTALGSLTPQEGDARPLDMRTADGKPATAPRASFENPPGLYGSEDGFTALNLMAKDAVLHPLDNGTASGVSMEKLAGTVTILAKPVLLTLAFILMLVDTLIVLSMAGAFARLLRPAATVATLLVATILVFDPHPTFADDRKPGDEAIEASLDTTHLAYVVTGETDVDDISQSGLDGLSQYIYYRTALEPGAPIGLDISKDELAFYPIIYWPVSATAPMPSTAAISRMDGYMRSGGTILFDTRDQFSSLDAGGTSANGERLQAILASLDIPPLEPVPENHVLTKSFFLLKTFPGRYAGGPLWIEASPEMKADTERPARSCDGVSPILITGNDLAGAWAVDANGNPLYPTVPNDYMQREMAFRTGTNIIMYMLTGNYKSDQVHIPALLERLGQ